jgi:outer membrane protein TolC
MRAAFIRTALLALSLVVPAILRAAPETEQEVPPRLDLAGALQFAIGNNFSIRQARERIREQEGLLVAVRARNLPNAAVNYYYTKFAKSTLEPYLRITDQDWAVELTVTQNVFSGGAVSSSMAAQKYRQAAAVLELKAVINAALFDVRSKFYAVLLAKREIEVAEQSLNLLEQQLKTVSDRYGAGTLSKFDLLRSQVAVANGRPPLIRARNAYRISIEELRQSLGFANRSPDSLTKTPEFLGELTYEPTNMDLPGALESARNLRPELQQLDKLEEASRESLSAARGDYWPSLGLDAGYQVKKSMGTNDLGTTRDGWSAGVQGSWAIFDGLATAGRVAQARSLLEQSRLTTAEQQLAVDVEVRRAFSTLQEADELVTSSKAVVGQAEESVRLAQARFDAGTATQLDVLESQVALTEARTNELQALYNHTIALASLRRAIGQGEAIVADREGATPK